MFNLYSGMGTGGEKRFVVGKERESMRDRKKLNLSIVPFTVVKMVCLPSILSNFWHHFYILAYLGEFNLNAP